MGGKYRANPILPLSLYQKIHVNVTAMRENEFKEELLSVFTEEAAIFKDLDEVISQKV